MISRFVGGLFALSIALAVPAHAVIYHFELFGSRSASFDIDGSRAPDGFTATKAFFDAILGTYSSTPATADIIFSAGSSGGTAGGFEAINPSLLGIAQFTSSELLFTGTTAAPVFNTGFFQLGSTVSGESALVITEVSGIDSTVPEPATWAMLMTGVGLTGTALRWRRRVAAASA